jgi:hypothetical protein
MLRDLLRASSACILLLILSLGLQAMNYEVGKSAPEHF